MNAATSVVSITVPPAATLRTALTPLTGILDQAQSAGRKVDQFRPLLSQLSATAPAVDQALRSGPGLRPLAEQADGAIATIDPLVGALNIHDLLRAGVV